MRAAFGGFARRLALTLAGEGIQSAFHFAINVALARRLSAEDYGAFAIVMVIGAIALTYMRALVGLPAALLVAERRGARGALAVESSFGSAALLLAAALGAGASLLFDLWLHAAALSAGAFVALWALRSYLRSVLLARRRQVAAMASDAALAATGGALAAWLVRPGGADPLDAAFLALAGANLAAVAVALAANRARPRLTLRRSMRVRIAGLGRQLAWSAAATTSANAQATGQMLLVAALGGPEVYAPMAAMLALFAPVRLLTAGLTNLLLPELAARLAVPLEGRTGGARPGELRRILALWSAGALAVGLGYGAVAAAALPLMGATVFAGQPEARIFALAWATTATFFLSLVPRLLLEVRRQFRAAAAVGATGAALGAAVVVPVVVTGHAGWALGGNLLAECVVLAGSWALVARGPRPVAGAAALAATASTGTVRVTAKAACRGPLDRFA